MTLQTYKLQLCWCCRKTALTTKCFRDLIISSSKWARGFLGHLWYTDYLVLKKQNKCSKRQVPHESNVAFFKLPWKFQMAATILLVGIDLYERQHIFSRFPTSGVCSRCIFSGVSFGVKMSNLVSVCRTQASSSSPMGGAFMYVLCKILH